MFRCPSTHRPTTGCSSKLLRRDTASAPTSSWSAPAPTRSSTSSPRRSSSRARARSSRCRPTRCSASSPSNARAEAVLVPRLGAGEGYALDIPAMREAARDAALLWLCSPNNPTALPEPDGAIETLLGLIEADARPRGEPCRSSSSTRHTPSSSVARSPTFGSTHPNLISSALPARPTRWPGCASGSPSRGPNWSHG